MKRVGRLPALVAAVAAGLACLPAAAQAGRGRVRDHRGSVYRPPVHTHVHWYGGYYRPYYYPYYPYYYPYDSPYYGAYYYGPPATATVVAPAPPPPRRVVALAVHLGSIAQDDDTAAGSAGLALRLRGRVFEGELELGRRYYEDDSSERSVAATLYANLGRRDAFHPYLLGGLGRLESDRGFAQVGVGLAVPLASRLTLAADARLASIEQRPSDAAARVVVVESRDALTTVEGRLSVIVDF